MTAFTLHQLPHPVVVTTETGCIVAANAGLLALVGGSASDWQHKPLEALMAPASRSWLQAQGLATVLPLALVQGVSLQLQGLSGHALSMLASCRFGGMQEFSPAEPSCYYWLFLEGAAPTQISAPKDRFMRAVTDALPSPMAYWDKDLICRFSNQRYLEWFGKTSQQMDAIHMRAMLGERLYALNLPYIEGALAGTPQEFEREMVRPDGTTGYTLVNYVPDIDSNGVVQGFNALVTNVTRLREADAAIRLSASVFDSTSEGIIVTDVNRQIVSANDAAARITGYTVAELLGQSPRMMDSDRDEDTFYEAMEREFIARGRWAGERWVRRKDGHVIRSWTSLSIIRNEAGKVVRYLDLFSDITERHSKDELLRHMALHDALTDLPNRVLLMDRLTQLMAAVQRSPHPIAVLFVDLDGFKQVNDILGHDAGDAVLKTVAQRLLGLLRTVDTVARLGGDEFVVVLNNPERADHEAHTAIVAQRIIAAINVPIAVGSEHARVGCSIGIAMHPQHGTSADALLKGGDEAMYAAKAAGKNTFRFGRDRT